ncbi:hypothetical protein ES332_D07G158100v1 [Gossypium tomentosum]|uniref:Uncharacterized protein n=1 Tax=Gossypium tomentosum TaxID=34277 RepID=A0A5D2K8Z1_GOSTO|nr:hypothetical protein ES332_D07G158100v1 [Gossypium tomentosum]
MLSGSRTLVFNPFLALQFIYGSGYCCNGLRLYKVVGPGFIPPNACSYMGLPTA